MNVRLVRFTLVPGGRAAAEAIADRVIPVVRAQPGCERCVFIADHEAGDYGIVVLWASKDHADAAAKVVEPILAPALAGAQATGVSRRLFEVYEPQP